jgi:proteasome lid subunit RPN8/RPN11
MREVCFILVEDKILRVYFGSATRVPDSRERWDVIWQYRDEITEIAHSHPGEFLDFSHEDITTMEAVEAGTGRQFTWSIVTKKGFLSRKDNHNIRREEAPWWLRLLRALSYGEARLRRTTKQRKE